MHLIDRNMRENEISFVENRGIVFMSHSFIHKRMGSNEIEHGIWKEKKKKNENGPSSTETV